MPNNEPKLFAPFGLFLCVTDTEHEPYAFLLSDAQVTYLEDGIRIARDRARDPQQALRDVYRQLFKVEGTIYAFPCWRLPMLEWITEHYEGPHKERTRGLAACIITGTPYGPDDTGKGPKGGTPVTKPEPPKTPSGPSGAYFNPDLLKVR